ncbi:hypothetical protein KIN20_027315 [Parelaphostrongylus tenuis]|uniref:Uncharacterized protein n=1 Tax=Parelaphostrongylus tenuis TaxID=148309 RepID=A0AAD5WDQ1_PARTN|nr:hypothetical protein KIN20_027315 [Parelaphostrongylus tenuis]
MAVNVEVFDHDGLTYTSYSRPELERESITIFDPNRWNAIIVEKITLKNITTASFCTQNVVQSVCKALRKSRQFYVRGLAMESVSISDIYASHLSELFQLLLPSCEKILIIKCTLPVTIPPTLAFSSTGSMHYRWLQSCCLSPFKTNDAILRRFAKDIRESNGKRFFHGEMDGVTVSSVCEFIEAWSKSAAPPYFNITLYGCCYHWRTAFEKECQRSNFAGDCNEFESTIIKTAHIKVVFIQDAELFRMWPIFDIPARQTESTICYARFYRDW